MLVGRDLKDRDRLSRGTEHLPDRTVVGTGAERLVAFLRENEGVDVLVLDLDEGGPGLLAQLEAASEEGLLPSRVVGFYSHVDERTGTDAEAAGVKAYPRSRFWRELASVLAPAGQD